jgi:beta-N-acetylhexosaminidase
MGIRSRRFGHRSGAWTLGVAGVLLATTLAVALGLASGGATARDQRAFASRELTLSQQVGQLLLVRFAGTRVPAYVRARVRERRVAGVVLFRDNVRSPGQLRALTTILRREGGSPIVAVDQEGGAVRTVGWAPPAAGAPQQAATGTVRASAQRSARALRSLGITVTLAPVADVPSVSDAVIASRSFSSVSSVASNAIRSAVRGWRAGGIASTAKHFPGLGAARVNSDDASVTISRSRSRLEARDLPPFRAAIRAGMPLVMVGHARYPALDPDRIASQSPLVIAGLLRNRLGFRGVVITDSMEAEASLATGDIGTVCERAVRAGADLMLLTGEGSYASVYRRLLAAARRSPGFRARVRESAARVLALKARGALPPR